jgi:hypothetical protein
LYDAGLCVPLRLKNVHWIHVTQGLTSRVHLRAQQCMACSRIAPRHPPFFLYGFSAMPIGDRIRLSCVMPISDTFRLSIRHAASCHARDAIEDFSHGSEVESCCEARVADRE